jgi:hypothetical protein
MPSKRKPEKVTFLFVHHDQPMSEKHKNFFRQSDHILLERPTAIHPKEFAQGKIKSMKEYNKITSQRGDEVVSPEWVKKEDKLLDEMLSKGKKIYFTDPPFSFSVFPRDVEKTLEHVDKLNKLLKFQKDIDSAKQEWREALRKDDVDQALNARIKESKLWAEQVDFRDKQSAEWLLKNLHEMQGKVLVKRGALHTGMYHKVKKALEKKGVKVEAVFIHEGQLKKPSQRSLEEYPPMDELIRLYRFGKKPGREKEKKLALQDLFFLFYAEKMPLYEAIKKARKKRLKDVPELFELAKQSESPNH